MSIFCIICAFTVPIFHERKIFSVDILYSYIFENEVNLFMLSINKFITPFKFHVRAEM